MFDVFMYCFIAVVGVTIGYTITDYYLWKSDVEERIRNLELKEQSKHE